jgi:hypothetical protein
MTDEDIVLGEDADYVSGYRSVFALLRTHTSFLHQLGVEKILALLGFKEEVVGKSD